MKATINRKSLLAASLVMGLSLVVAMPAFAAGPRSARFAGGNRSRFVRSASITVSGTVSSIYGSSFTLNATTGQSYTVNTGNAMIVMKDGSALPTANIEVNDLVTVLGTVAGNAINASQITDSSLWRFERVSGTVVSVSGSSFSLQTTDRGTVTVNIAGNARVSRSNGSYNSAYPVAGEYARATGTWDQANNVLWTTDVRVSAATSNGYNGYNNYNGYASYDNNVYNNNANGTITVSMSPYASTLQNGQSTTVNASAYDGIGLSNVVIYVGGVAAQTCSFASFTASFNCTTTLYGSNYSNGSTVSVYARLTDVNGYTATSSTATIYVQNNNYNQNNQSTNANGTVSLSLSPYASTLANGQSTTITATAYDPNGVTSTNLYVNGSLVISCPVTSAPTTNYCTTTVYGSNYANGSTVSVYAQATDVYGNVATSSTSYLTVSNLASTVANEYATLSLYPFVSSLGTAQSTTVTAAGSDANGVGSVGIYVNGALVKTCSFGNGITSASCTYNLAGSNYPVGSIVSIYAHATDANGSVATSSTSNLTIVNASSDVTLSTASLVPHYGDRRNGRRWDGRNWR